MNETKKYLPISRYFQKQCTYFLYYFLLEVFFEEELLFLEEEQLVEPLQQEEL